MYVLDWVQEIKKNNAQDSEAFIVLYTNKTFLEEVSQVGKKIVENSAKFSHLVQSRSGYYICI